MSAFAGLLLFLSVEAQQEKEILSTIEALYRHVSFSDSNATRLDSLINIFTADGRLIANFGKQPVGWSVAEYIASTRKNISTQGMTSLSEKQLSHKLEVFGKIAHCFSTYELRAELKGRAVVRRGINSIQLLQVDGKWLITSLTWDREGDDLKIPEKYF